MDSLFPQDPHGTPNLQRCLESFLTDLHGHYDNHELVPSAAVGVRRLTARRTLTGQSCFISVRQYEQPLTPQQLDVQRAITARLSQAAAVEGLGALVEFRVEPEAHYVVSTLAGTLSLHQVLRQQRRLAFNQVCDLLTSLAESLEKTAVGRWPVTMVDAHAIFLDARATDLFRAPVQVVVPPLPGPEIQPGAVWMPPDTKTYISSLALLACELLGMPVRAHRFRPLPLISAEINQLLRQVIEGSASSGLSSARHFATLLRAGMTAEAPPLPQPVPAGQPISPPAHFAQTQDEEVTAFIPPPEPKPQRVLPALVLPAPTKEPPHPHLRLTCVTVPELPRITLFHGDALRAGRGLKAHFVSQFFPRSPSNDERTRMVSREHLNVSRQGATLSVEDMPAVNQSFIGGRPLEGKVPIGRFCRVSLAGEYDLELRRINSWWPDGRVWVPPDVMPATAPEIDGALLLSPAKSTPALEYYTSWIFTDAAFGVFANGAFNLQPVGNHAILGWFVTARDGVWVVACEDDGTISLNGAPVNATTPVLLEPNSLLRVGIREWQISDPSLSP